MLHLAPSSHPAQEADTTVIPAPRKAAVKADLLALLRLVQEEAKKAGAANKEKAVAAAVAAADAAAAAGKAFLVTRIDVGLDVKALGVSLMSFEAPRWPAAAGVVVGERDRCVWEREGWEGCQGSRCCSGYVTHAMPLPDSAPCVVPSPSTPPRRRRARRWRRSTRSCR